MGPILRELSNPVWWFSVVVAGLAVNIVAGFLKDHADNVMSRYSASKRARSEAMREARQRRIEALSGDADLILESRFDEMVARLGTVAFLLLAVLGYVLANGDTVNIGWLFGPASVVGAVVSIVLKGVSTLALFMGLQNHRQAMETADIVDEARELKRSRRPSGADGAASS